MRKRLAGSAIFLLAFCLNTPVHAQSSAPPDRKAWQFASGSGNILYLGVGALRPLLDGGNLGRERTLRALDALTVTTAVTYGLKSLTREERPDHSNRESFPSGHASAAFTVAAMESRFYHREAPLWYLGASLIAASRVRLHRHYIHDVVAGAALGFSSAEIELAQPKGLLTAPFVHRNHDGRWVSLAIHF